jgi:Protein of unknown function (DUF4236)
MGWGFRKSINFGPLRINASKSGIGYSIGGRGFRIGKDARGKSYRAFSIPGTGIYNRTYQKKNATSKPPMYTSPSQPKLRKAMVYVSVGLLVYLIIHAILHLL